jgi:P27 family predicted phage terminase small subunit
MARRGPKPKPTALKILEGVRADRINGDEPAPPAGVPERPAQLDGLAAEEWDRVAPVLASMRVLTSADVSALAVYCQAYARHAAALEAIAEHGIVVATGEDGDGIKANPAAAIAARCEELMLRVLAEFGGTPSSRSGLKAAPEKTADKLGSFLSRRKG